MNPFVFHQKSLLLRAQNIQQILCSFSELFIWSLNFSWHFIAALSHTRSFTRRNAFFVHNKAVKTTSIHHSLTFEICVYSNSFRRKSFFFVYLLNHLNSFDEYIHFYKTYAAFKCQSKQSLNKHAKIDSRKKKRIHWVHYV